MAKANVEKKENKAVKKEVNGHMAKASARSLHISTKQAIEICDSIRYKTTKQARELLENVVGFKKALPFKRFNKDMGHKPGRIAAGRYPQKAANEFLKLLKSVEANAQVIGLDSANLKIQKVLANKAPTPMTGGRQRRGTKRTHIEIEVVEGKVPNKKEVRKAKSVKKVTKIKEPVKEVKVEKKVEDKTVEKEEIKKEEQKLEQEPTEVQETQGVSSPKPVKEEQKVEQKND
ncbi:MAG: 50S ribosomal protein L22 [archaeon]